MKESPFSACSKRMQAVQQPIIPQVSQWIRDNPGTISLGQGIVDYPPPPQSFERLENTADIAYQAYRPVQGEPQLLDIVQRKLAVDNNISFDSNKQAISMTAGSNMAFMLALFCITSPGDEVILLSPYYFNHDMAIGMLSCKTIAVACTDTHQPDMSAIQAAITDKTRAIVTVSPNNPTGAVYSADDLRAINALCKEHGIYHISDEAYEYFIYDDEAHFSAASITGSEQHTLSLFSLSKAYGFAAWRVGYIVLPRHLKHAALKAQDTQLICVPIQSQLAAMGAMSAGKNYCLTHLQALDEKRHHVAAALETLSARLQYQMPNGAFYFYLQLKTDISAIELSQKLIEEYQVALIPGETFGSTNSCCLRMSYGALNRADLVLAIQRFRAGITALT